MDIRRSFYLAIIACTLICGNALASDDEAGKWKTDHEIKQALGKKGVSITLKRKGDGRYEWDLRGDSVEEITQADKRLREYIKTKK